MEKEGPPREVDAPLEPKEEEPKEPEVKKEDISWIEDELKKIRLELAGKAPWWILWVLFILLGGIGAGFLLNGFVFKTATWAGYLFGLCGAAVFVWVYKKYKQAEAAY